MHIYYLVIDSMGHLPTGVTEVTASSFGEYDECLEIQSPSDDGHPEIEGQYCLLNVKLPYPLISSYKSEEDKVHPIYYDARDSIIKYYQVDKYSTVSRVIEALNIINGSIFRIGICLPSTCKAVDVENALNKSAKLMQIIFIYI